MPNPNGSEAALEIERLRAKPLAGVNLDKVAKEHSLLARLSLNKAWRWAGDHEALTLLIFVWLVGLAFTLPKLGWAPIWAKDYLNYWFAPRALRAGIDPYDVAAYKQYGMSFFPDAPPNQFNFTYPPHSLFLFWPLSYLPSYASYLTWCAASLAVFWFAVRRLVPKGLPIVIAVLSPATILCVHFGQTSLISGCLFLLAAGGSGAAAGLLTIKPQLGFLTAPLLLSKGRKPVLIAIGVTVALVVASMLAFGHWKEFIDHAGSYQAGQIFDEEAKNNWYVIGTTPAMGYGRLGFVVYLVVATIVLVRNFNVWTAATATFLISPYGFHYDMSVVCVGFAVLVYMYWNRMPLWQRLVAALGYLAPVIVEFGTWWVPPIILLGLFIQTQYLPGVQVGWKKGRLKIVSINETELQSG